MKRIGLLGGTFDPPHIGHLALATECARALQLDEVVLMPTAQPPHKIKADLAPARDRLAMCREMAKGSPLLTVSDYEIRMGGASFTVDTLSHLTETRPDERIYLLTGGDMFLTLATWRRFADIAKMAVCCAVTRGDTDLTDLRQAAEHLRTLGATTEVLPVTLPTVSSTEVRSLIAAGKPWESLVPPSVAAYIRQAGLYTDSTPLSADEQYKAILRGRLGDWRYAHSLAVADEARRLALRWGGDPDKAYTAGLLHDILKEATPDEQRQIFERFGGALTPLELAAPKLWHAMAAPPFLQNILGVTDPEILSAIRYHTTAKAGMTPLETIVFLADFTAVGRDYPDVEVMRQLVDTSTDQALHYALSYTVNDLTAKGKPVHPDTLAALSEVRARLQKGD